jgi:Zn-dependent membrane protease YugP
VIIMWMFLVGLLVAYFGGWTGMACFAVGVLFTALCLPMNERRFNERKRDRWRVNGNLQIAHDPDQSEQVIGQN